MDPIKMAANLLGSVFDLSDSEKENIRRLLSPEHLNSIFNKLSEIYNAVKLQTMQLTGVEEGVDELKRANLSLSSQLSTVQKELAEIRAELAGDFDDDSEEIENDG